MSEFQGTAAEELLKNVILSLSGVGAGFALYLACVNIKRAFETNGWTRRLHVAYACARIGFTGTLILVAEAVFRSQTGIPVNFRSIAYTVFLIMATGGYIGVFWEKRHTRKARLNHDSEADL